MMDGKEDSLWIPALLLQYGRGHRSVPRTRDSDKIAYGNTLPADGRARECLPRVRPGSMAGNGAEWGLLGSACLDLG